MVNETKGIRQALGDKFFGATFEKRDGTLRHGTFRLGVRRDLKGVGMAYDTNERGNLIVWDVQKKAYRTIRLEALISIRVRGREIVVRRKGDA